MKNQLFLLAAATALVASSASAQSVFSGNGGNGFGGPVGNGNVTISDTASSMTIALNNAAALNDDLVLYLQSPGQSGGFADTSTFLDNGDGGRTAISGYNSGNPSQTLATFGTAGLLPDYAISIENNFIGVFELASGGNNSLNYLFGQSQSGSGPYSITLTAAEMAQIGLIADSGQTFHFVGTLDSGSAYRSDETIGGALINGQPAASQSNPGFIGTLNFVSADSYTLVPEPSTLALMSVPVLAFLIGLRRRK